MSWHECSRTSSLSVVINSICKAFFRIVLTKYLFIITVFSIDLDFWGRIYKYLTIYRKFIVRSTHDGDLKSAKISFRNIVS